jgi:hypothetical protein
MAKLRQGDWTGWHNQLGDRYFACAGARRLLWEASEYDGITSLVGKTLLIAEERGIGAGCGDGLQILCFVPPLAVRVGRLIVALRAEILEFVRHNVDGDCDVISSTPEFSYAETVQFDHFIWSRSLPTLFDTPPQFIPLHAPTPASRSTFDEQTLQIGFCWAANDELEVTELRERKLHPFSLAEPLLSLEGISWHSLQVGVSARNADPYLTIRRPSLKTFSDTANLIAALDAVVTVDTAVFHLAGRLGVPVFLLLERVADGQWGFGDTTPWYPSARIIRAPDLNDWSGAVAPLIQSLTHFREEWRATRTLLNDFRAGV